MCQKISLNLNILTNNKKIPKEYKFLEWVAAIFQTLNFPTKKLKLTILIADSQHIGKLNYLYRSKDFKTDVLSFTYNTEFSKEKFYLGDIIICPEAFNEKYSLFNNLQTYWAQIILHGVLHLLGYQHAYLSDRHLMQLKEI